MIQTAGIETLAKALVAVQAEIEGAKKNKNNPAFRGTKYADLASVWDACRELLSKNGLAVIQLPCEAPAGYIGLTTCLVHTSGQYVMDRYFMPLKDATNPQAAGSAITYARRYALSAVIGICPDDDDANGAAGKPEVKATVEHSSVYEAEFAGAEGKDAKKAVFLKLRGSNVEENNKNRLLTEWATIIRGME